MKVFECSLLACGRISTMAILLLSTVGLVTERSAYAQSEATPPAAAPAPTTAVAKLTGHSWKLVAIDDHDIDTATVVHPPEMTLLEEGSRIVGITGCNRFSGTYVQQKEKLSVNSELAVTRRACPSMMNLEASFLKAIQSMDSWKITDGVLEIYRGTTLLAKFKTS
jgi:heat shock protein HslJ